MEHFRCFSGAMFSSQQNHFVLFGVHDDFLAVYIQAGIYTPVIFIAANNNENRFWTI